MEPELCWNVLIFVTIAICSLVSGALSVRECSDSNLSIRGGNFTLSEKYNYGSILRYQCAQGYYPYPVKKRKCSRGNWDPAPTRRQPECKKVTCPNPKVLEHGDVEPYLGFYYVNDITSYRCHSDYTLKGSSTRICQLNGKWNGSTPICSRDTHHCPDPGTPPGAIRTAHIFDIDDTVSYHCDNKLRLLGSKERVCQDDGTWSGQEPECYADFTYDTPEEVAQAFGGTLKTTLTTHEEEGQQGKKIRLNQKGKLNIYIALDASDSIDKDDFEKAKDIMIKLIENIRYYEVFPNYDILVFATHVTKIVNITDRYKENKDNDENMHLTIEHLKAFEFDAKGDKSGTNIAKAYQDILESISLMNAINKTIFKETHHVIIMFTDGIANMGGDPTYKINEIKQVVYDGDEVNREQYLDLYVFGVGDDAEEVREYVNEWVTKRRNEKHFFLLEDMTDMQQTLDEMIDESTRVGLCGLYKTYKDVQDYDDTAYPWMTKFSIHHDKTVSHCLGSLVTPSFILTAAHCFKFDDEPGNIHFEIPKSVKAKTIIRHPEYKLKDKVSEGISEYYVNDVALIELERPVKVDVNLRPICIPCTKETSGALRLSGSGVTCQKHKETLLSKEFENAFFMASKKAALKGGQNKVHAKQTVQIRLKEQMNECIKDAEKALNVSADTARKLIAGNFLCTGGSANNQVDEVSCKGDSGGATFVQQTYRAIQVGVVSWGLKELCDAKNKAQGKDFHVDLFNPEVQNFLKKYLGDETREYNIPLNFL